MTDQAPASTSGSQEHDLPMIRVHRAWRAAERLGEQHGVDPGVALQIAREVIGIVGGGTRRWGHLCVRCRSLMTWDGEYLVCPEHGRLSAMSSAVLLIAFDPNGSD